MQQIRRYETTEQAFKIDVAQADIAALRISYEQNGNELIHKELADVSLSDIEDDACGFLTRVYFAFTQSETASFSADSNAKMQMRIITDDGQSLVSDEVTIEILDTIYEQVMS